MIAIYIFLKQDDNSLTLSLFFLFSILVEKSGKKEVMNSRVPRGRSIGLGPISYPKCGVHIHLPGASDTRMKNNEIIFWFSYKYMYIGTFSKMHKEIYIGKVNSFFFFEISPCNRIHK